MAFSAFNGKHYSKNTNERLLRFFSFAKLNKSLVDNSIDTVDAIYDNILQQVAGLFSATK